MLSGESPGAADAAALAWCAAMRGGAECQGAHGEHAGQAGVSTKHGCVPSLGTVTFRPLNVRRDDEAKGCLLYGLPEFPRGRGYSRTMSASSPVLRAAERARVASHGLALATREQKDRALHAMADALLAGSDDGPGRQRRGHRARGGERDAGQHRRPAAAHPRAARGDGAGAARRGRAARPGRRGGPRQHAGQRARAAPGAGAVRGGRHHLRGPAQRHRRRRRDLPEVRQRRAAPRQLQRPVEQRRDRRRAARRRGRVPAWTPTWSSWCPATPTRASRS